jgi:general secretion pathway protein B
MSLILDALRKMEQERKAKQGAAQDLRPEVLRYRSRISPKQGKLPVMVSLFLVAVAVGAASFYIGKRDAAKYQLANSSFSKAGGSAASSASGGPVSPVEGAPSASSPQPFAAMSPATESAHAPPENGFMAAVPDATTSAKGAGDILNPVTTRSNPAATAANVNRSSASILEAEKAAAARQARAQVPVEAARTRSRETSNVEQVAPADITISGIAFQDERHLRRAVINGTLVGEGEEVAGARVVEIKEHKVRMSRGGKLFDVPFGTGER